MRYCQRVSAHGLDAEKIEVLRRWGEGLQTDAREEVAAAGRAILLLIEEIERLHVLLWDRKLYPDAPLPPEGGGEPASAGEPEPEATLGHTLRERLRRARRNRFSTT